MSDQPGRTDPEEVPRTLALLEIGEGVRVEVWACRRRRCFGRTDWYVEPARGRGGKWVRAATLEFIEEIPEQGGKHE